MVDAKRCKDCPIRARRVNGSLGPKDAPIVFIGEAPSTQDIAYGMSGNNDATRLLHKELKAVGINPKKTLYLNALQCKPTEYPIKKSTLQICRSRLLGEIQEHPRQLIVPLGTSATRSILNVYKGTITNLRGTAISTTEGIVLPIYHPTAVIKNNAYLKTFRRDLEYLANLYLEDGNFTKNVVETPEFSVVGNDTESNSINVEAAIKLIESQEFVAADIETTGLNPNRDKVICMGVAISASRVLIFPAKYLETPAVRQMFKHIKTKWVWHNGKFDTSFVPARVDHDTMLMHYALDENPGTHSLKGLARNYLRVTAYETELDQWLKGSKKVGWSSIPTDVLYKYLAKDCSYTFQLFHIFHKELLRLPNTRLLKLYETLFLNASSVLQQIEANGIQVDPKELQKLHIQWEKELEEQQTRIEEESWKFWNVDAYVADTRTKTIPEKFNPNSSQQLGWVLYKQFRLRPRKGNKPTVDAPTLEFFSTIPGLEPMAKELIQDVLQLRKLKKLLSTYIKGIAARIEKNGRIHSTYKIHGTVTGRLSAEHPNVQNIAGNPEIKNLFIAPTNKILIEADYSQAELRTLAVLSKDKDLQNIFSQNKDLHSEVATSFFGPDFNKTQRRVAKMVNFGIIYGVRPMGLAYQINNQIELETPFKIEAAATLINQWNQRFPVAKAWLNHQIDLMKQDEQIQSPIGRVRRFPKVPFGDNDWQHENQAMNFVIQSMASDFTLISSIELIEPLQSIMGAKIINLVHDSILVECPDAPSTVSAVINKLSATMEQIPLNLLRSNSVPFTTDIMVGTQWGNMREYDLQNS